MIAAESLSKYYGQRRALDDVSFRIGRGEVVGFLGPNGAGKTTLLKLLSGVSMSHAGDFCIDGYSSRRQPLEVRRRVGFLPDRPPLYDDMRVGAMLRFAAELRGLQGTAVTERVAKVVQQCGLSEVQEDLVRWLSHGYRQRVGIAMAIVHAPALLILDEPINGLDPQQIRQMRELIRTLAQEHTVLLSSHILAEVEHTCDRLLILNRGRLVAQGREANLRQQLRPDGFTLRGQGGVEQAAIVAQSLPGLRDVQVRALDSARFELLACGSLAARSTLVTALVQHNLGVEQLAPRQGGDLEALFLGLTEVPPSTGPGES